MIAPTRLNDTMNSLTTRDNVMPDNLLAIGNTTVTHTDQVVSEKVVKTYKTPVLSVDPKKVIVNPDNTVSFSVSSNLPDVAYRYQIDGGQWISVSPSSAGEYQITTSVLTA